MLVALGGIALGGCTEEKPQEPCLRRKPDFRMQVTAGGAELPGDTLLHVKYQGSVTEEFGLSRGNPDNQDVCCRAVLEPIRGALPPVRCGEVPESGPGDSAGDATDPPPDGRTDGAGGGDADATPQAGDARAEASVADARAPAERDGGARDAGDELDAAAGGEASAPEGGERPRPRRPRAIICQLWTEGEAQVTVTASGYEPFLRILDAEADGTLCGTETVDVRIDLGGPDAGL